MYYRTLGIILRRRDYRESDGLFSIYTRDRGKIEAIAKGVKKIKSKLGPHLDYFAVIDLMLARGKSFYQLAGATVIKNFSGIKTELRKISLASYCLEIVDILQKEGQKDEAIWRLLKELLEILDRSSSDKDEIFLVRIFSLKLLSHLGYAPELYNCLVCQRKILPKGNIFVPQRGGLVCGECQKKSVGIKGEKISTDAIKVLRLILEKEQKELLKIKMKEEVLGEVISIIDSFVALHLEREPKTKKWLAFFGVDKKKKV